MDDQRQTVEARPRLPTLVSPDGGRRTAVRRPRAVFTSSTVEGCILADQWLGRSVRRKEDARLISGRSQFIDDVQHTDLVRHAAILRSPHAHGPIVQVNVARAQAA